MKDKHLPRVFHRGGKLHFIILTEAASCILVMKENKYLEIQRFISRQRRYVQEQQPTCLYGYGGSSTLDNWRMQKSCSVNVCGMVTSVTGQQSTTRGDSLQWRFHSVSNLSWSVKHIDIMKNILLIVCTQKMLQFLCFFSSIKKTTTSFPLALVAVAIPSLRKLSFWFPQKHRSTIVNIS